ncbi:unnamed protein product [Ceutorhynchus assimilis]|uniref:Uncharacterized protein n=1 Tax=Ceutorhynchus assimilis TaxID=467358 RepID=A0A9N9QPD9_9CUCU|nr:unnamed protein product [Ceutorhynchus assimilis]
MFSFRFLRIGLPHCKMIIDYKLNFGSNSLLHPNLPADDYCLDNTEDNREVIRVCTDDFRLCESTKCIHKCCPDGQSFVNGSVCKPTYVYGVNLSFSENIDQNDDFVIVHGYTGKIYLQPLSWDFNLDSMGVFRLFDEKIGNEIYEATEETYCIEHATKNGIEYGHRLFRMYPKTQIEEKYFINGYVMIVSTVFLILTIMFYICFGETKKLFGKTLVSFSVCLALNFLVLIYSTFNLDDIKEKLEVCYTLGFLLLYGEFGTFLWLKLLCFDIYYTFGSGKVQNKPSNSHLKRFWFYSLYGWGLALVLTIIPLILFFTDILPEPIQIMMGFTRCAIERENGNYADLLFRTVPVTILQIINLVLFYRTVKCCIDVKNEIRKMTDNNQHGRNNKFLVNKERFMLVTKLSVIMGLSYIFEVVSSFYEFNQTRPTKYLEIVWDIINCLQGVFIFLIFICKKKMFDKLKSNAGVKRLRKISLSSAATLTTHLSFDKDKKIQIQNDFNK